MNSFLEKFERRIVLALLVMLMVAVLVATGELAYLLLRDLLRPPFDLLIIPELQELFGFFLMVLLGLELIEMMKAYLIEDVIHVEIVLLVAIVAVGRKIVILDYKTATPELMYGVAAVMLSVAAAYFLLKRCLQPERAPRPAGGKPCPPGEPNQGETTP